MAFPKCCSILLIITQILLRNTYAYSGDKFFRKDYKYIEETQSFYKIHTLHKTWYDARDRCEMEGAILFYPEDKAEVDVVVDYWIEKQPYYSWVYIGISDLVVKEVFQTVDGRSISEVFDEWSPGEPNNAGGIEDCVILHRNRLLNDESCNKTFPFICKKTLKSLVWNEDCDIPNTDYTYIRKQNKCYKFHAEPKSWTDAAILCNAEQSYLAVINSQSEADHLVQLTAGVQKDNIRGNYLRGAIHLGFHNRDNRGWKTVKGTTIPGGGYSKWSDREPDGNSAEKCGAMFFNGRLTGVECNQKCFFICEHDV